MRDAVTVHTGGRGDVRRFVRADAAGPRAALVGAMLVGVYAALHLAGVPGFAAPKIRGDGGETVVAVGARDAQAQGTAQGRRGVARPAGARRTVADGSPRRGDSPVLRAAAARGASIAAGGAPVVGAAASGSSRAAEGSAVAGSGAGAPAAAGGSSVGGNSSPDDGARPTSTPSETQPTSSAPSDPTPPAPPPTGGNEPTSVLPTPVPDPTSVLPTSVPDPTRVLPTPVPDPTSVLPTTVPDPTSVLPLTIAPVSPATVEAAREPTTTLIGQVVEQVVSVVPSLP